MAVTRQYLYLMQGLLNPIFEILLSWAEVNNETYVYYISNPNVLEHREPQIETIDLSFYIFNAQFKGVSRTTNAHSSLLLKIEYNLGKWAFLAKVTDGFTLNIHHLRFCINYSAEKATNFFLNSINVADSACSIIVIFYYYSLLIIYNLYEKFEFSTAPPSTVQERQPRNRQVRLKPVRVASKDRKPGKSQDKAEEKLQKATKGENR